MAAEQLPQHGIAIDSSRPLVGVFVADDSDVVEYFAEDPQAPVASPSADLQAALSVIGAWSDMDWDELADSLDRIRHESRPTPPIELDDV